MSNTKATEKDLDAMTEIDQIELFGPGNQLRTAREAAGLNQEEIAERLRLTKAIVEKIENNDFNFPRSFVFIRGYLRSYAGIVNISGDEVVEAFNSLNLKEVPTDRPVASLHKKQLTAKDRPIRWITYLITLTLIVLVVMWWHSQRSVSADEGKGFLPSFLNRATSNKEPAKEEATNFAAEQQLVQYEER